MYSLFDIILASEAKQDDSAIDPSSLNNTQISNLLVDYIAKDKTDSFESLMSKVIHHLQSSKSKDSSNKIDLNTILNFRFRGNSLLMLAAEKNNLTIVSKILEYNDKLESVSINVNDSSDQNVTSLFFACRRNNIDMVKLLMSNGANPNIITQSGKHKFSTMLVAATQMNNIEMMKTLLNDTNNNYKHTFDWV